MYKLVQIVGYADDINIMARTFKAAMETFKELTWKANEIGLIVNENKMGGGHTHTHKRCPNRPVRNRNG
jgi:uncharacterized membrane protein YkvA (DUF1232 family)